MSTQNNTLTNPDVSEDRKQECEAELIESPPSTTTYAYNKELGLGSEEKPTDDEQTDDAFSSTKSDTEAMDLAEDALVPEEGKDAADTKTKEVVEPSTEEKMAQQITDVSVPPLIQTQPQQRSRHQPILCPPRTRTPIPRQSLRSRQRPLKVLCLPPIAKNQTKTRIFRLAVQRRPTASSRTESRTTNCQ